VPIACIEQEWSLVSRDLEADIVPVCRDLGIVIVAYSPLGRGLLAGAVRSRDDIPAEDPLAHESAKFADGNLEANLRLVDSLKAVADRKGCTVGQLALAWLHAQAERHGLPAVVPIPRTTSLAHLNNNVGALDIALTHEDLEEIEKLTKQSHK
jgi:aryl-alcohol dehydrogenase-like predicted oxidoreductase